MPLESIDMNERWRRLKKSTVFCMCIAWLGIFLAKEAFHFLPLLPAIFISVGLVSLFMVALFPRKQELQQNFKDELTKSKRAWKKWNR
ncbi:hypothetical protein B5P43_04680 [Bacillus sp. SRB_336]|nr:hypothetical protein B5P43_04680 [Bacillus sp. SRB_336]